MDFRTTTVAGLADDVSAKRTSARELVGAALSRIEEVDAKINAFVEVDSERALEAADKIEPGDERPFAGVPIAIKATPEWESWPAQKPVSDRT